MHDTAFQIGTLVMNIYADLRSDGVLEIGSQAVNGSLRDNALPTTRYVGVDIEAGEGVDVVVEPGERLPVDDESFELVMASSVFEHDPCFWMTFLEMCRAAKDGGYIYLNAPSNGLIHRYPQDNWRFYPDSGKALARWAVSQGMAVTLVESFIAKREKDIWNDFVAVFRKGPITKKLPKIFVHEHVPCTDVITWKSKEILSPSEQTEDMVLLTQASERARAAESDLERAANERDFLGQQTAELEARLAAAGAEAADIRGELGLRESELRQRQEEIEQTRAELLQARSSIEEMQAELIGLQAERESQQRLTGQLASAESDLARTRKKLAKRDARIDELVASLSLAQSATRELEQRLAAHFHETASLSKMVLESQHLTSKEAAKVRRIRELYDAVISQPRWWSILPRARQSKLQRERLHRLGVFDGGSYLHANPDVAAAGEDALHHYLHHGIDENRPT